MRMESLLSSTRQYFRQTRRVRQSEDAKAGRSYVRYNLVLNTWGTYFGVDEGAQTTANDSGSMRWKPECVCKSTEDIKPRTLSGETTGLKQISRRTGLCWMSVYLNRVNEFTSIMIR